jgi:hypothetical protein
MRIKYWIDNPGCPKCGKRFEDPKPLEDPKPGVSVGTKQNHPVAGIILGLISFAPLVGAGLFGMVLPCIAKEDWNNANWDPSSYCRSADPMLWLLAGGVATILVYLLVYWKCFPENIAKRNAKAQIAPDRFAALIVAENRALAAAGGRWDSVPKVVCPHCQEVGGVQHFTPYEAPRDLLKEGVMWHLTGKTIGHVEVTPAEKIGRDIREASQVAQTPNMRCTNCTIEWRV